MKIKRYGFDYRSDSIEKPDGQWVRYEDHAAEVKRLRELLKAAQQHALAVQRFVAEVKEQLDDNDPADDWKKGGGA